MLCIKEVEIAKSMHELLTSRSIVGYDFPHEEDFNMDVHFRKRVSVKEQPAQKHDWFLRGRQIAYMIYEYFRATGSYEAVQGLADLFTMSLQNDDVQDFDVRWDHALLTAGEMPSDAILEGLYKSKLQNSFQLQTVMALYDHDVPRNNGEPNYQRQKTAVKLQIDQMMRTRTPRARNDVAERGSVTKGQRGNKAYVERKSGRVLSMEGTWTMFQRRPL